MRGLLWLLVLSALAVALSLAMRGHGGYALFVLHPWRAEISLNLLAILLIVVFAAGYFLLRLSAQGRVACPEASFAFARFSRTKTR